MKMNIKPIGFYLLAGLRGGSASLNRALAAEADLERQEIYRPVGQILVEAGDLDDAFLAECLQQQRVDVLRSMELFESLPPDACTKVAAGSLSRTFPPGTTIFRHSDKGDSYYMIISGKVLICRVSEEGDRVPLATLGPGEGFGEIALLTGEPRSASAETLDKVSVVSVPKETFDEIVVSNPVVARGFIRVLAERLLRGNVQLAEVADTERAYRQFIAEQLESREPELIGTSPAMKKLLSEIQTVAQNSSPVLITGEPGTEIWEVAGMLHRAGRVRDGMLLSMNAKSGTASGRSSDAAGKDPLMTEITQDGILFGRRRHALPFDPEKRLGLLQIAGSGTIVIEHIEDLALRVQGKLADVLSQGRYQLSGQESFTPLTSRIIVTSHADLKTMTEEGRFDSRLYQLLAAQTLTVPPLRKRKKDISMLIGHFIARGNALSGRALEGIDEEAYRAIMSYDWPGNTDELNSVVRRAVSISRGRMLQIDDIFIGPPPVSGRFSFNLLKLGPVRRIFQHRSFPAAGQLVIAPFLVLIILAGLFGSQSPDSNIAIPLTWGIWEPLLVLGSFFAARLWCGVCPLGAFGSLIGRYAGPGKKVPVFFRKYGLYVSAAGLAGIFWAESASGMLSSPRATALLIVSIVILAAVIGMIYQRRAWCRYLCPLGGMVGVLSGCSVVELRSHYPICNNDCRTHACFTGCGDHTGCPVFEGPFSLSSNQHCILCGECIKSCAHHSPVINLRLPGYELWNIRTPDRTVVLLGTVLIGTQTFRGLEKGGYFHLLHSSFPDWWAMSLGLVALAVIMTVLFIRVSARMVFRSAGLPEPGPDTLVYGLMPLAVCFEAAFQIERVLLLGGQLLPIVGRQVGYPGDLPAAEFSPVTIKVIQTLIILAGAMGSAAVMRRLVSPPRVSHNGPAVSPGFSVPVLLLAVFYLWLFLAA